MNNDRRHLVHFAPATIRDKYGAGNWKDITAHRLMLTELPIQVSSEWLSTDHPADAVSRVPQDVTDAFIEYTTSLELLRELRRARPEIRLHVRAHNAEGLQHKHRSNPGFLPTRENLRNWYGCARLTWRDRQVAGISDTLLSISEWDSAHYWKRIASKANLVDLPYVSPWPLVRSDVVPAPWESRELRIVCMPGGGDRLSAQQRENFQRLSSQMIPRGIRCEMSGGILPSQGPDVEVTYRNVGRIAEPWDWLCQSLAIAVLTDLGFGMKTTIVDGLAAGCHVLVHHRLLPRLPQEVAKLCIPFDPVCIDADELISRLRYPPVGGVELHDALRERAMRMLNDTLFEHRTTSESESRTMSFAETLPVGRDL